jgi:hypothetical protein
VCTILGSSRKAYQYLITDQFTAAGLAGERRRIRGERQALQTLRIERAQGSCCARSSLPLWRRLCNRLSYPQALTQAPLQINQSASSFP